MGVQGKRASERRRRVQGCVDGKNVTPPHGNGGRWVDGKKALHNPAHRCAAGNRRFCLPYAFGNAGDRCGDVQRVLNARFAGERTAFVHYSRTFETEKRVRRWRRDRLCGHFDGRGGMTSPRAQRRFGSPSPSHPRGVSLVFVRPQRHRSVCVTEDRQYAAVPCTTSLRPVQRHLCASARYRGRPCVVVDRGGDGYARRHNVYNDFRFFMTIGTSYMSLCAAR